MNLNRRQVLQAGGKGSLLLMMATVGLILPIEVLADDWNKAAFGATTLPDAFKQFAGGEPAASTDISFTAPDIAENGAVVPLNIVSKIPNTQQIAVLIEKNPNPLAASFDLSPDTDSSVAVRVKMSQTSNVIALVKADGKYYFASKEVKVTLGGCVG